MVVVVAVVVAAAMVVVVVVVAVVQAAAVEAVEAVVAALYAHGTLLLLLQERWGRGDRYGDGDLGDSDDDGPDLSWVLGLYRASLCAHRGIRNVPPAGCDCGHPWKRVGGRHVCRYFGYFSCACGKRWTSAYTWKGERQALKCTCSCTCACAGRILRYGVHSCICTHAGVPRLQQGERPHQDGTARRPGRYG